MRAKLLLVTFGTLLGAAVFCTAYLLFKDQVQALLLPDGARYENAADLRAAIDQRDDRDRRADGVSLRQLLQTNPSDDIIFQLRPNFSGRFRGIDLTFNSYGMRDREIGLVKGPGTYRIAVLGDSYAFGWGVEQPFSRRLETELNLKKPGSKFEVLNFAVPGYSTFQEVAQFLDAGARFKPDAVLVYVVYNDFALPFFIRDPRAGSDGELLHAEKFHEIAVQQDDTPAQAKRDKLLKDLDAARSLSQLGSYCSQHNMKLFVVTHPDRHEGRVRSKLWGLKRDAPTIKLISIHEEFDRLIQSGDFSKESLTLNGDEHPGPGAHAVIGTALANVLAPLIDAHE